MSSLVIVDANEDNHGNNLRTAILINQLIILQFFK